MEYINTKDIYTTKLDDMTVLIEAKEGVEIDQETAASNMAAMVKVMPGNFGMIILRRSDYSIVPIDVYKSLNKIGNLKAIALVLPNKRNALPVATEQKLFKGELQSFMYIREAHEWTHQVLHKQTGS